VQLLDATVEDTLTWTPDSIMVDVATSFTDDTTTTIDLVPTPNPFEENEPFVDNSAKEEWAYTKAMSLYKQITDTVETKDDLNVLIDGLNHLHVKVMARCAKRKGLQPAQGQSGRFSDWTQADTRKKGKRKTPACSPSRRKGRKRKRNNHRGQLHTLKELTGNQLYIYFFTLRSC